MADANASAILSACLVLATPVPRTLSILFRDHPAIRLSLCHPLCVFHSSHHGVKEPIYQNNLFHATESVSGINPEASDINTVRHTPLQKGKHIYPLALDSPAFVLESPPPALGKRAHRRTECKGRAILGTVMGTLYLQNRVLLVKKVPKRTPRKFGKFRKRAP